MKMFSWFDASESKKFGKSLAQFVMEKSPLDVANKKKEFIPQNEDALLKKMSQQILDFKTAHKLNIYKKAQTGNAFKWTLKDTGYESEYVDALTSWLMLRL
jgi:hypothetical protein